MSTFSISNSFQPEAEMEAVNKVRDSRSSLTEEQELATSVTDGRILINAGSGTGKSTCLVAFMRNIVNKHSDAKVLMISFTKKSALELKERVRLFPRVTVSTFHSLAYNIIKQNGYGDFRVVDAVGHEGVITKLIGQKDTTLEDVLSSMHTVSARNNDTGAVRAKYLKWLTDRKLLTYDSMQLVCLRLLVDNPAILRRWQQNYSHVLVDEYQDVDAVQIELLKLLTAATSNLCVVGDSRQAIYGFRGGVSSAIEDFSADAKAFNLTTNYRSNKYIVGLGNKIMADQPPLKAAYTGSANLKPEYLTAFSELDEARAVVGKIKELHKAGLPYKDIFILFRSFHAANEIVDELLREKIPTVSKNQAILKEQRQPIEGAVNLIRFALKPSPTTFANLGKIFYLNKAQAAELIKTKPMDYCEALLKSDLPFFHLEYLKELLQAIKDIVGMSAADAFRHLVAHGYGKFIGETDSLLVEGYADTLEHGNLSSYLAWLDDLTAEQTRIRKLIAENNDAVNLLSIHASKGLEADTVFIVGCYDGCIPSSQDNADISEEARLLYVAVTRAKERLYISYPRTTAKSNDIQKASRFIAEAF